MLLREGPQIKANHLILLTRRRNWIIQADLEKRWGAYKEREIKAIKTSKRVDIRGEEEKVEQQAYLINLSC